MTRPLHRSIALEIAGKLQTEPGFTLPSISEICDQWDVAYATAWKTVRALVDMEVATVEKGRRMRAVVHAGPESRYGTQPLAPSGLNRLCNTLRERIAKGVYRAGTRLPKLASIAAAAAVTTAITTRALRILAAEGLVHKCGKWWHAGKQPSASETISHERPGDQTPEILVIVPHVEQWRTTVFNSHLSFFRVALRTENLEYGYNLSLAAMHPHSTGAHQVPSGFEEIKAHIRALGWRYQGALLVAEHPEMESMEECIDVVARFGKPVVFFDAWDRGPHLDPSKFPGIKQYFRLYFDHDASVDVVLEQLQRLGHRRVIAPHADALQWTRDRFERIVVRAQRFSPAITVVTTASAESQWHFFDRGGPHNFITAIAEELGIAEDGVGDDARRLRAGLVRAGASLASVLSEHEPTAIIALTDDMAREYYFWLQALDIRVPKDLSLISFDNAPESIFLPVSTLDPGFGRLGYIAAHIFVGDLPIAGIAGRSIAAPCRLAQRGSLSAVGGGKHTLRTKLRQ